MRKATFIAVYRSLVCRDVLPGLLVALGALFLASIVCAQTMLEKVNEFPAALDDSVQHDATGVSGLSPEQLLKAMAYGVHGPGGFADKWGISKMPIDWCPNRRNVVATLPYRQRDEIRTGIFLIDLKTGQQSRIADGSKARLSPNGKWIAYVDVDGSVRIEPMRTDREERTARDSAPVMSPSEGDVAELVWSPTSQALALIVSGKSAADLTAGEVNSIRTYDLAHHTKTTLYSAPERMEGISWGARGIFFARGKYRDASGAGKAADYWAQMTLIDPISRTTEVLVDDAGFGVTNLAPNLSLNGRKAAFSFDPFQKPPAGSYTIPGVYDDVSHKTAVYPLENNFSLTLRPGQWRRNSTDAVYRCKTGGLFSSFCVINTLNETMRRIDINPLREIGAFSISPFDDRMVWLSEDVNGGIWLTIATKDLAHRREIHLMDRYALGLVALGKIQSLRWSTADHVHLGGLLILPVNYIPQRRFPLIVDLHGGPMEGILVNSAGSLTSRSIEWQMWAAKGYAVLVGDYRSGGAAGLKEEYIRRVSGFKEDANAADVLAGIDEAIRLGVADPNRVGAIGQSNGATVLNWLIIKSKRLKAAIVKEGFPALWDGNRGQAAAQSSVWLDYRRWLLNTDEVDRARIEAENAPISYPKDVSTPMLYMAGNTNINGILNIPRLYVESVRAAGGDARLLYFPDEGHGFVKEENVRESLASAIAWFDHLLSDK